jgi:hypothetical protein
MALLTWFRKGRAASRYARALPPWLARSYGASEHYSVGQIRAAVTALGLDGPFVAIAYAAFMRREEYDALAAQLRTQLAYKEARDLFLRFVRPHPRSASGEPGDVHSVPDGWQGPGHGT